MVRMFERHRGARILGTGSYVPPKIVTNEDLEKLVETSDEWIVSRTGIKERHVVDGDAAASDLALMAANQALEAAGLKASDMDQILVATVTPDRLFPSTACTLQEKLGVEGNSAMDIGAACSGFVYGLAMAGGMISSGVLDHVLLIGVETLSKILNWRDRGTCVLFGDGAGAAVIGPAEGDGKGILSVKMASDGAAGSLLELPAGGSQLPASHETVEQGLHYIKMQGNEVFKYAVRAMEEMAREALAKAGMGVPEVDLLITHQANLRIIRATAKRLVIPMEKVFVNVNRYGNTSAASIPLALDEAVKEGRIKDGDLVELVTFGAGFTWAAAVIRW
jgi:3-oxoacyl-[acyl-carrier-protein] synthase-3